MIPAGWRPHPRADGEAVGCVREAGDGVQAMDLLGRARPTASAPPPTEWPG